MLATDRRPDLGRGVFETLLVVGGRAVEREAHLRRLARSLDALYAATLPAAAAERVAEAAAGLRLGRLRLTALPGLARPGGMGDAAGRMAKEATRSEAGSATGREAGSANRSETGDGAGRDAGVRLRVEAREIDPAVVFPARGVRLRTHRVPGGLGTHKLAYRQDVERPALGEAGALIVDAGETLEAGWANLFAVREETLWTPPLDGRLLAGTARAAILALAAEAGVAVAEDRLRPDDLPAAEEVFLSNSIRGIEPALELDGQPLAGRGPVSNRLAAALRRRWGLPSGPHAPPAPAAAPPPGPPAR